MRIVSLLPSTTEILFAIGAGYDVVGVTFECDFPEEARTRRIVSTSAMPEGLTPAEMADVFSSWNEGRLKSYLIEITAKVLEAKDPATGKPMVDIVLDTAGQKGTGRWSAMEAQDLGVPATVIEAAVAARGLSAQRSFRLAGE